jgi:TolA-binding protein
MNKTLVFSILVAVATTAVQAQQPVNVEAGATKSRAYQLYEAKRFDEAATQFQFYVASNPEDARALYDYASLLSQLNRHGDAAKQFETLHQKHPRHEAGYFKLGVEYVSLQRPADAEKVFTELQQSSNAQMAAAATDALKKLKDDLAREARMKAEARVFELARESKHREVVAAVTELEKQGDLSYAMQMQRLHAWNALHEYAVALDRAEQLSESFPQATDLALLRADVLAQLGRRPEAETIWRRLAREHPGTPVAVQATQRLEGRAFPPVEDAVFALVRQQRHREAVAEINEMESAGELSWLMKMQRVYSLQEMGDQAQALERANQLSAAHPESTDLALIRADLLIRAQKTQEAAEILKKVREDHPETPAAQAAADRLHALPPIANLDKWYWGEAYASGDYLGRYGTLVGSGFARHGWFLPEARWLQPYVEHRFGVDTRSGVGRRQSIIADNHVGFYGGVRAQLFESEYLFVYVQGGMNKDLLDRRARADGDWTLDYQAGIYGFKSWGPGTVLHRNPPGSELVTSGDEPTASDFFWRGDWFVEAGANFSYYERYSSWIGYGQAREGFRVFQVGPSVAFDTYLVENVTWDVRGNYFDNSFDFGPGARFLWVPHPNWQVVLRAEWLNGFYFGRDGDGTRGNASRQYDGVQVGLSVGARW